MMKMQKTPEEWKKIVKECVETEKRGEDVIAYLRGQGYIYSAESTWRNIQKRDLKRSNITNGHPDEAKGTKEVALEVTETATAEAAPEEEQKTVKRRGRRKKAESETEIPTIEDAEQERETQLVTEKGKEMILQCLESGKAEKEPERKQEGRAVDVLDLKAAVKEMVEKQVAEYLPKRFDERSTAQIVTEDRKEGVKPAKDRFRTTAVESELGRYRIVEYTEGMHVEFKLTSRLESVAMTVDGWKVFLEEMPEALKRMGVWG